MSSRLKWSKIKRRWKFYKGNEKAFWIVGILTVGFMGYLVVTFLPSGEMERSANSLDEAAEIDTFERVIDEGTLSESTQFLRTLTVNNRDPLPIKIETLRKKFDLADRVIELSEDEDSINFGKLKQLESRLHLERLFSVNGQATNISRRQLRDQAASLVESQDEEVSRISRLALIYEQAVSLEVDGVEINEEMREKLHDSINEFAQRFPNGSESVLNLADYVKEMVAVGKNQTADELMNAVSVAYQESQNPVIMGKLVEFEKSELRSKYQLTSAMSSVIELQNNVLRENSNIVNGLIDAFANKPDLDDRHMDLVNALMLIMQAGFPEEAGTLADKSVELFQAPNVSKGRKERFEDIRTVIGKVGSEFNLPQAVSQDLKSKPTLIIMASSENVRRGIAHMRKVGQLTRLMTADQSIDVVAVYLEDAPLEGAFEEMRQRLSPFAGIRVHRLSQEDSKTFLAEYPFSWLPTWIVLDREKKLHQVSPPLPILEKMLIEMISSTGSQ